MEQPRLDRAERNDITINIFEEDTNRPLILRTNGLKDTQKGKEMSLSGSSISTSVRLWRKLRFHEKEREEPRINETGAFPTVTTLKKWKLRSKRLMHHTSLTKNKSLPHSPS